MVFLFSVCATQSVLTAHKLHRFWRSFTQTNTFPIDRVWLKFKMFVILTFQSSKCIYRTSFALQNWKWKNKGSRVKKGKVDDRTKLLQSSKSMSTPLRTLHMRPSQTEAGWLNRLPAFPLIPWLSVLQGEIQPPTFLIKTSPLKMPTGQSRSVPLVNHYSLRTCLPFSSFPYAQSFVPSKTELERVLDRAGEMSNDFLM